MRLELANLLTMEEKFAWDKAHVWKLSSLQLGFHFGSEVAEYPGILNKGQ